MSASHQSILAVSAFLRLLRKSGFALSIPPLEAAWKISSQLLLIALVEAAEVTGVGLMSACHHLPSLAVGQPSLGLRRTAFRLQDESELFDGVSLSQEECIGPRRRLKH